MKKNLVLIVLVLMVFMSACSPKVERPEGCKWYQTTTRCIEVQNGKIPVRWQDAVQYHEGGSGPADPASVHDGNQTAVDHESRLIASNPNLDVRACFAQIDDESWSEIAAWAEPWGSDSPTRVEWQVNESRCSLVFPGDITDPITKEDYERLLDIFAGTGYGTWFVSGNTGAEWGRSTYDAMEGAPLNRVHVFGPTLPQMPTK